MRSISRLTFIIVLAVFSFLTYTVIHSAPVATYVTAVKAGQSTETLKMIIEKKSLEEDQPAIDARTDKIWGNIPGLDGIVIDQEATLELAKKQRGTEGIPWIYKTVPAKISLEDLKPNPVYRGNENKKAISLMINVAWGTEYLPSMLETLKKNNVKATFFLDGSWANKNRDVVKRLSDEGHEIGNHAYTHPSMSRLSEARIEEEIVKTEKVIEDTLGHRSTLFAPPSGDFDSRVVDIAHKQGLKTILWTLDTVDWQKPSPEVMINRIVPKAHNGALVLMHPTANTAKALPTIIKSLKEKGYDLVPVSDMLNPKRIPLIEEEFPFW